MKGLQGCGRSSQRTLLTPHRRLPPPFINPHSPSWSFRAEVGARRSGILTSDWERRCVSHNDTAFVSGSGGLQRTSQPKLHATFEAIILLLVKVILLPGGSNVEWENERVAASSVETWPEESLHNPNEWLGWIQSGCASRQAEMGTG